MSNSVFLLVRIAHVVTGTVWVGGAVLVTVFVAPAIRAAGPAGAYVTWMRAADSPSIWIQTGAGRVYSLGAISAFLAAAILLILATAATVGVNR